MFPCPTDAAPVSLETIPTFSSDVEKCKTSVILCVHCGLHKVSLMQEAYVIKHDSGRDAAGI